MLFIVYRSPNSTSFAAEGTPLLLPISRQLLNQSIYSLKSIVHAHFKQYLSPFISQENIKLVSRLSIQQQQTGFKKNLATGQKLSLETTIAEREEMINQFPLYMYIDPTAYFQEITCTVKPNRVEQRQQKWKHLRNAAILVMPQGQSQGNLQGQSLVIKVIPKEQLKRIDAIFSQMSSRNGSKKALIINGVQIQKSEQLANKKSKIVQTDKNSSRNNSFQENQLSKALQQCWTNIMRDNECIYIRISEKLQQLPS